MFEIRKKLTLELIVSIVLIYNSIYIDLIIGINSIDRINLALIKCTLEIIIVIVLIYNSIDV